MSAPISENIELSQKRLWFWKRTYKMSPEGLRMTIKTPFQHAIKKMTFEEIGRQVVIKEWVNLRKFALIFLIICFVFYLFVVLFQWDSGLYISLTAGIISSILSILMRVYPLISITLAGGSEPVTFYLNLPNSDRFEAFFQTFMSKHKNYMLEQYVPLNSLLSYEYQYDHLMWLKEKHFLSDEEYKAFKNKLDSIFEYEENELFPFSLN